MKKLCNAYGQRIGTRSITYDEQYKLALTALRVQITPLIHTLTTKNLSTQYGTQPQKAKMINEIPLTPSANSNVRV